MIDGEGDKILQTSNQEENKSTFLDSEETLVLVKSRKNETMRFTAYVSHTI